MTISREICVFVADGAGFIGIELLEPVVQASNHVCTLKHALTRSSCSRMGAPGLTTMAVAFDWFSDQKA